jgi:cellulose synthase/poly-beta-1,6-N-acetylglucosamine synthase-like glycosyltransferase
MIIMFWTGVLWLVYVYAGYLVCLALVASIKRVRLATRECSAPSVSVLIAARNEEKDILWKIAETLAWNYPPAKLEVLIASDASDDRTDELVQSIKDPRVNFIRMDQRGGKGRALNRLAQMAQGDLLFFTDANAHIGPDSLRLMTRHFSDPRVGCVTGDSRAIRERDDTTVASGASVYWGYESLIKHLENRLGAVLVCDGAIFCMRRSLYVAVSPELANDLELPLRVAHAGYRVLHEPLALVFERETTSPWQEFARRRRMCAQGFLGMLRLWSTFTFLRAWMFASHKLLRWLTLIPMLMILASCITLSSGLLFFSGALVAQIVFYGLAGIGFVCAANGQATPRVISVPFYVVLGVAGALVGVAQAATGKRFDVWEIPTLSRGAGKTSLSKPQAAGGD